MCLAIPGKILDCTEQGGLRVGRIQFGGIVRQASLDFVPEAQVGDYVMVHVGFAISRVDAEEAERTYQLLAEMGAVEEELPRELNFSYRGLDPSWPLESIPCFALRLRSIANISRGFSYSRCRCRALRPVTR